MRPHPRIRKTIKWGGLLVGTLVLVGMATTTRYTAAAAWRHWIVSAYRGGLLMSYDDSPVAGSSLWLHWWPSPGSSGWCRKPSWGGVVAPWPVAVPLWMPALASLIASALAWRLDTLATRRAKLGACPTCSYPRTGLAPSSPCPECGAAAPQS